MPRLKVIDPATATGRSKEIFEGPLAGKHFNILKGLANSGAGFQAYLALSGALKEAALTTQERELVALLMAELNSCDYCLAAHSSAGKRLGLTEDQMLDARNGTATDPRHRALLAFTTALHEKKGFVSDEDLEDFRSVGYDDGHIVEVIATYALNLYTNYFNHVNETPVDFPAAPALAR